MEKNATVRDRQGLRVNALEILQLNENSESGYKFYRTTNDT